MLIIVGLGNPGGQYAGHRHNVGFMALDAIHRRHGFAPWRRRFSAEVAEGTLGGEKALLVKPQTYMNESGRAVGEAARFYKVEPKDILVIHDEIDLRAGTGAHEDAAAAPPATTASARSAPRSAKTSGGCASASAIPASRSWSTSTSSTTSPRTSMSGSIR